MLGRKRLNLITKQFTDSGTISKDKRGGARVTETQRNITESIIAFIKKLKVESHYGRGQSTRQYLPSDLNITKLYTLWKVERTQGDLPDACRSLFAKIFRTRFNLSFCTPKIDLCSYCEEMRGKDDLKSRAALWLHKIRARHFYDVSRK